MTNHKPTIADQIALEEEMRGLSMARYEDTIRNAKERHEESSTSYGNIMLKGCVDAVAKGIQEFITEVNSRGAGRRGNTVKYLEMLNPHVVAFLTGRVILDKVTFRNQVQRAAVDISNFLEQEVRWAKYQDEAPGLWNKVNQSIKTEHAGHKSRVLSVTMNRAGIVWEDWPSSDKLHLGMKCIELFVEKTGMVELVNRVVGKNDTKVFIEATQKTLDWISRHTKASGLLMPVYFPTIVPPVDWTSSTEGGYHTHRAGHIRFVKTRNKNYIEELRNRPEQMSRVYAGVNAMQRTAWKINTQVLDVLCEVWERGLSLGKLPSRDDIPVPTSPLAPDLKKEDMTEEQLDRLRSWKKAAAEVHDTNWKTRSRRLLVAKVISIAQRFKEYEEVFFPHNVDFRGRVYALPMFLNPQGADVAKGLLTFAHGKAIEDGVAAGWLAIHGANVYGYDKASLEDRISWVEERNERILATAQDPLSDLWWCDADKPWQFLAFIFEWAGFLEQGFGYVSSMPVALDGSCNGLQHFSAMLRDSIGGAAVNLLPSDKPQDIYQRVADKVTDKLRLDACEVASNEEENTPELARMWLEFVGGAVPRSCTKRSVMVLPYGGTLISSRSFVDDFIAEQLEKGKANVFGERRFIAAAYLAKLIWSSIGEVVIAARQAMDWLQKSSRLLSKESLPVSWTAPSGFPVLQAYPDISKRRVKTKFGDQLIYLTLDEDKQGTVDSRRQANGISPNFVHSMDAAAMILAINKATEYGITSFAMIHDSYGTLAADTEVLSQALRVAFVEMYEDHDVLAEFKAEVEGMLSEGELPELPAKGSLELEQVLESDFFFA